MEDSVKKDILDVFNSQKEYFNSYKMLNIKNRIDALKKLKKNIMIMLPKIYEALKIDLNKSENEAYMTEVGIVLTEINYMLKNIRSFARPKRVATPITQFHAKSYMIPSPYGSALIISPWNYPFMLSIDPLVDAISAGNSAVIKPSEISPHVSDVIKELIDMTFERGHVDVVLGGVEECTEL